MAVPQKAVGTDDATMVSPEAEARSPSLSPSSRLKAWRQSAENRLLFIKAFREAIPLLEAGREGQVLHDILRRLGVGGHQSQEEEEHRVERALVPRLRRLLLEMSDVLGPTNLLEVLSSKTKTAQHVGLLKLIANEISELKSAVTTPWTPSTKGPDKKDTYLLQPYYFPDLPWEVDQIRDDTIKLFTSYIETLKCPEPPSGDTMAPTACLGEVLESVDRMYGDFEDPGRVMRAKWKYVAREIEIMHITVFNCLKPRAACKKTDRTGRDEEDPSTHPWPSIEDLKKNEIKTYRHYIPLLKICRLLLVKLCRTPSSEPLLTWRMTAGQLQTLYQNTEGLEEDLRRFTTMILEREIRNALSQFDAFLVWFNYIIKTIEDHLASLRDPVDREHVKRARKWCLIWKVHYLIAIQNFAPGHTLNK